MKVGFIGETQFSLAILAEVVRSQLDVEVVFSRVPRESVSDKLDICFQASAWGIPCHRVPTMNTVASRDLLASYDLDAMFCVGWTELLDDETLACCPSQVIGYHPTALPRNRGRHPLIWALALGLTETASTYFLIDSGVDSGAIISQESVLIRPDDYAMDLYDNMTSVARRQVARIAERLNRGELTGMPQDQSKSSSWRKRTRADGRIDWRMSSDGIRNLVRALSPPYGGAYFDLRCREYVVHKAESVTWGVREDEPGKVLERSNEFLLVKCGEGAIVILESTPTFIDIEEPYL